jgi:hypothetical protein
MYLVHIDLSLCIRWPGEVFRGEKSPQLSDFARYLARNSHFLLVGMRLA